MPTAVAGYTDFYSSKEHATNVGVMFRGKDNALQPNWLHMPIHYNGRASTVVVSGHQGAPAAWSIKATERGCAVIWPLQRLDFELEMGRRIGSRPRMGETLATASGGHDLTALRLLNDWSARDIQQWEYVPLGPFQAKRLRPRFSPWIVTREAWRRFGVPWPGAGSRRVPYLRQAGANNYDLQLDVGLRAAQMNEAASICRTNFKYSTGHRCRQLVHHASSGCAMNIRRSLGERHYLWPGGSTSAAAFWRSAGRHRAGGVARRHQADISRRWRFACHARWCQGDGYRVGFGEVEGAITPANDSSSLRAKRSKPRVREAKWIASSLRFSQ